MGVSPEAVAAWLSASCAEQGVPVVITDPRVLAKVAALLAPPAPSGDGQIRQTARTRSGSKARLPG